MNNYGRQIGVPSLSPMIKKILFVTLGAWVLGVVILQGWILEEPLVFAYFGMTPAKVIGDFFLWQPLTYIFLHSQNIFHIVFNMLSLWLIGGELEAKWGSKAFLRYYLITGAAAGVLYCLLLYIYAYISGDANHLMRPVIGASGSVFALFLAYGVLFGERVIYAFGVFPLKAKFFVMILGGIEIMSLMSSGFSGQVSNLSHLLGILTGYIYLLMWTKIRQGGGFGGGGKKRGRNLKLVVDNERKDEKPKYWN